MESIRNNDLKGFDRALWGHVGFALSNLVKSIAFSWTDGCLTTAPLGPVHRYYQLIHGYSSNLAFLADFSMLVLGGELKRREKLSARLGDVLSYLYLASAVLKRFHEDGSPEEDLPLVDWCCQHLFIECALAIRGIISNFPGRWQRLVLKMLIQPLGIKRHKPNDRLGHTVAKLLSVPSETRARLTRWAFREPLDNCPEGRLDKAFLKICLIEPLEKKLNKVVKSGQLKSLTSLEQIEEATGLGLLTTEEAQSLHEAEVARQQVLAVDDFNHDELARPEVVHHSVSKKKITNLENPLTESV
jgi:acyl-CoA dehydrogenase